MNRMLSTARNPIMLLPDMQFGPWVAYRRKQLGLTQSDLAVVLHVKQPIISKIEKGTYLSLSDWQIEELSKVLKVKPDEVTLRMRPEPPVTLTDSAGRSWRVISREGRIAKEVAEALGVLGLLEIIDES